MLIVSDGRGLFSEGSECVHQAIRRAKQSGLFMVFVILDNPDGKDSILDIRVPIFDMATGKLEGIKPYLDSFPFPFYVILRDIQTLPVVLSDALRQWFELVTSSSSVWNWRVQRGTGKKQNILLVWSFLFIIIDTCFRFSSVSVS